MVHLGPVETVILIIPRKRKGIQIFIVLLLKISQCVSQNNISTAYFFSRERELALAFYFVNIKTYNGMCK